MNILTPEQLSKFELEGYLVIRDFFDPAADLDPIIEEYAGVLDRLADRLFATGEIKSTYEEEDFSERLIRICEDTGKIHAQSFDFSLPQRSIQADTPIWSGPAVFNLLRHPHLLDLMEQLIGGEIYSNPIQHARLKLPEARAVRDDQGEILQGATQWHQDNGVALPEADATDMITVWLPLWDAPIESGCLEVIPRSHRDGIVDHCPLGAAGFGIPDKLIEKQQAVSLPMERGDVLLLHRRTCHSSLPNLSNRVRWSFDLRYNPTDQPSGRDAFPGFVARSRTHPETELHDPAAWATSWLQARAKLSGDAEAQKFNRWDGNREVCA
ncbi:MAG: phytanoyl-CoA dioxygenase [Opitutaceae bacterium]|jgi:phytanoyl-CoA hydroxylase|nr:phytanoyl-CoA dioxygenase [Opitutaceae bacterium]